MAQIFQFQFDNQPIRFVDGKPVANDVASALGYKNPADSVYRLVKDKNKSVTKLLTNSGVQQATVLEEAGVYELIFSSRTAIAKRLQDWLIDTIKNLTIQYQDFTAATDNSGFIYLLAANIHYKIGCSKTPQKRLQTIQSNNASNCSIIHRIFTFDMYALEKALHKHYKQHWVRGEWFDLPQSEVDNFIVVANQLDGQQEQSLLPDCHLF